jgi:hypothetical protein
MTHDFLARLGALASAAALAGCAAGDAMINHSKLEVQTHMSETVFLDPVPQTERTVYVTARNTSDHPDIDLRGVLAGAIAARGYQIVTDPDLAHYMLRINVLQAGEMKDKAGMLAAKYGEPLIAGAVAAGATSALGGSGAATTGAGLGVGLATFAANQFIKNVAYSVVVDMQLSERPRSGAKVKQSTSTLAGQANGSSERLATAQPPQGGRSVSGAAMYNAKVKTQQIDEDVDFKQYQLREVAYAEQVNLKLEEAAPMLVAKLTNSLSNLFE